MKNLFLKVNYTVATMSASKVPGVYKTASAVSGDTGLVIVLSQTPNDQTDNKGGWNFFFQRSGALKTSLKANPLYDSNDVRAAVPATIPCNFETAQDCLDAYNAGTNIANA